MTQKTNLHRLIPFDELISGKPSRVEHEGKKILLCRVVDEVHAVDDLCTHEDISLSLGVLCEHRLRCPLHGSEFDIRNGKVLSEPADADLGTYPVKVVDAWVCLPTSNQLD